MKEILYAVLVLGIMGAVFGAVLAIASKVFAVKTDERLPKLIEALPGANCGGCGFAGCQAYAQAVLEGRAEIGLCVAGGQASADRMAAVMGVTAAKTESLSAMELQSANKLLVYLAAKHHFNDIYSFSVSVSQTVYELAFNADSFEHCIYLRTTAMNKNYLYAYLAQKHDIAHNSFFKLSVCHSVAAVFYNDYLVVVFLNVRQSVNKYLTSDFIAYVHFSFFFPILILCLSFCNRRLS